MNIKREQAILAIEDMIKEIPNIKFQQIMLAMFNKYNVPFAVSSDFLSIRKPLNRFYDIEYLMYCFLDTVNKIKIKDFFTKVEIDNYSRRKYNEDLKSQSSYSFKVIKVSENQWIGRVGAKELVAMNNVGKINYNTNTQRVLKVIRRNGIDQFKINVNRGMVSRIKESYINGSYIPDTITLNIPIDADFYYDEDTCTLTVNNLTAFDITDGYHRFTALNAVCASNDQFDYDMELRLTYFTEQKAMQFIWQQDQKTKMSKIQSESLNKDNPGNLVATWLSESDFLNGVVARNGGNIDFAWVASVINSVYFNERKKYDNKTKIIIKEEVRKGLENLISSDINLLDEHWTTDKVISAIVCIKENKTDKFYELSNYIKENAKSFQINKLTAGKIKKLIDFI